MRFLVVLFAAALLLLPAAAPGAKPRCAKGEVRLPAANRPCVALPALTGLPTDPAGRLARVRAVLDRMPPRTRSHRRLRRRAKAPRRQVLAALTRKLSPPAVRRSRAQGADDAKFVRVRETPWLPPAGQEGAGTTIAADLEKKGMAITESMTMAQSITPCPDPQGVVRGVAEFGSAKTASLGGIMESLSMRTRMAFEAQVGEDARLQSYRYRLTVDLERGGRDRGRALPTQRSRAVVDRAGLDPRRPRDYGKDAQRDPRGFLAGEYFGPKGRGKPLDPITAETLAMAAALGQAMLEKQATDAMLAQERLWYDHFTCVDVTADPEERRVAPGSVTPVSFTAVADDGAAVSGVVEASAHGGEADPPAGTIAAGAPFVARFTKDAEKSGGVSITLTSRRGRGFGAATLDRLEDPLWDVRYEASGHYAREESQPDLYVHEQDASFDWKATFNGAQLRPDQPWADIQPVAVTGVGIDEGVTLNVPFGCEGTVFAYGGEGTPAVGAIVSRPHGDGGVEVQLVPFSRLDRQPRACSPGARPWHSIANVQSETERFGPYDAVVHLSREDLQSDRVVRRVTAPARQYAPGCADDGPDPEFVQCDQRAGVSGEVTLTRRDAAG